MKPLHFKQIVLLLGVFLLFACSKDLITGKKTLNYYKVSSESKLGEEVLTSQIKELKKKKKSIDSPRNQQELKRIREIVKKIAAVSHYPKFPYEAHLADVDIVNAWCAPGGKIMVYEGLWDPKEGLVEKGSDDELAAVLAHEIAHATARHVTESLSTNMTIAVAGTVAQSAIAAGGAAEGADLFGQIFTEGFNVFVPSYSRSNESEADRLGLFYMAHAGYDPRAAVRLWERAAKRRGDKTSIYATHPSSGERAKKLKELLPEAMEIYKTSKGEKSR